MNTGYNNNFNNMQNYQYMNQLQYQPMQPILNQAPLLNPPNYGPITVLYPIGSEVRSPLLVN